MPCRGQRRDPRPIASVLAGRVSEATLAIASPIPSANQRNRSWRLAESATAYTNVGAGASEPRKLSVELACALSTSDPIDSKTSSRTSARIEKRRPDTRAATTTKIGSAA